MKNRIPDYLLDASRTDQPSARVFRELRELARKQLADGMRQTETFVREHPVSGLGAAFCIGILLGWIIRRK